MVQGGSGAARHKALMPRGVLPRGALRKRGALVRDVIADALCGPNGYFATRLPVLAGHTALPFREMKGRADYERALRERYAERAGFLTPAEIFAPWYSYAAARWALAWHRVDAIKAARAGVRPPPMRVAEFGVGSGTNFDHIQCKYNADDGFEWFGGSCDLKYGLCVGIGDDSFDYSFGWSGRGQFWLAQQNGLDADRGFEVDNSEDEFGARPLTNQTISNVTLIGDPDTRLLTPEQVGTKRHVTGRRPFVGQAAHDVVNTENFLDDDDSRTRTAFRQSQVSHEFAAIVRFDGDFLSAHPIILPLLSLPRA